MFGSWGIGLVLAVQSCYDSTVEKEKVLIGRPQLVQALYKVWLHMGCKACMESLMFLGNR